MRMHFIDMTEVNKCLMDCTHFDRTELSIPIVLVILSLEICGKIY